MAVPVSRYLTRELKIKLLEKQTCSYSQCQRSGKHSHLRTSSPKISITSWLFTVITKQDWPSIRSCCRKMRQYVPEEVYISLSLEELGKSRVPSISFLAEVHHFRIFVQDRETLLEPHLMLMCVSAWQHKMMASARASWHCCNSISDVNNILWYLQCHESSSLVLPSHLFWGWVPPVSCGDTSPNKC